MNKDKAMVKAKHISIGTVNLVYVSSYVCKNYYNSGTGDNTPKIFYSVGFSGENTDEMYQLEHIFKNGLQVA